MTDQTTPLALLRDAENYLSALHGSVARHDHLAANLACAGCELRDRIAAVLPWLAAADQTAPLADRLAHPEAVREQVRRALDFTYAVTLGYESSDQLLATYDASRTPADQTAVRETAEAALTAVEAALGDTLLPAARAEAFAGITAVLPAPADQGADTATMWAPCSPEWLRAMPAGACSWAPRKAGDGATVSHYHPALSAPVDRAAVLREAADALGRMDYDTDSSDYGYDTYCDAWNGGVMDGAALLRRVADEAAATETTADEAARLGMTPEEYRAHRHLAAVRQIRAALPGLYATTGLRVEAALTEPAAGAQQDETAVTLCAECGHPKAAHREGDDPVSPGQCSSCPDDDSWHDYQPAAGARPSPDSPYRRLLAALETEHARAQASAGHAREEQVGLTAAGLASGFLHAAALVVRELEGPEAAQAYAQRATAGAQQDGARQPGLRERHRAAWAALTPEQQAARLAELDADDGAQP